MCMCGYIDRDGIGGTSIGILLTIVIYLVLCACVGICVMWLYSRGEYSRGVIIMGILYALAAIAMMLGYPYRLWGMVS